MSDGVASGSDIRFGPITLSTPLMRDAGPALLVLIPIYDD
jgi:hypothetical protein